MRPRRHRGPRRHGRSRSARRRGRRCGRLRSAARRGAAAPPARSRRAASSRRRRRRSARAPGSAVPRRRCRRRSAAAWQAPACAAAHERLDAVAALQQHDGEPVAAGDEPGEAGVAVARWAQRRLRAAEAALRGRAGVAHAVPDGSVAARHGRDDPGRDGAAVGRDRDADVGDGALRADAGAAAHVVELLARAEAAASAAEAGEQLRAAPARVAHEALERDGGALAGGVDRDREALDVEAGDGDGGRRRDAGLRRRDGGAGADDRHCERNGDQAENVHVVTTSPAPEGCAWNFAAMPAILPACTASLL